MYVCHCNRIPERDVRAAIDSLTQRHSTVRCTPADVLLELNRFGKCLGCFPLIDAMLAGTDGDAPLAPVPDAPELHTLQPTKRQRRRGGAFARRSNT